MKKTISLLLVLVLLFSTGAARVGAEQPHIDDPLSEPIRVEYAMPQTIISGLLSGDVYLDEDAAAAYVRQQLQARSETIVVKVQSEGDAESVFYSVFYKAVAHTGEPTGGDYIYRHMQGYKGSVSYYPGKYTLTYHSIAYHTTSQQEQIMDAQVAQLLAELDLWNKSDYEKVLGIYDYITHNVTYDYENLEDESYNLKYSAYAALVNKTAVCQGYANLFYRLALELGVDSRIITGIGNGGGHAWNIVKLDGRYYNLDATWDAAWVEAGLSYEYFLRCDETFDDHFRDEEFDTYEFYGEYPMGAEDYTPPAVRCGDVNGDGHIDGMDATLLLQYAAGWRVEVNKTAADANGDGHIDGMDATLLLQYAAGWNVNLAA